MSIMINKITLLHIALIPSLILLSCNSENCYKLSIDAQANSTMKVGTPVVHGRGIGGFVTEISSTNGKTLAKFCLPKELTIPQDSKIFFGYSQGYMEYCVLIEPGTSNKLWKESKSLSVITKDTILLPILSDSTLTKEAIRIMRDFHNKSGNRKDSAK